MNENANKVVKEVVGQTKVKPSMLLDNDKDGVANVFDCEPNNPKKQGLIDTIKEKAKNTIASAKESAKEAKYTRQRERTLAKAQEEIIRDKEKEAAYKERTKQRIKTAEYKEKMAGERARQSKSGGFGALLGAMAGTEQTQTQAMPTTRKVTKYVKIKKGKNKGKYRKVTKTIEITPKAAKPKPIQRKNYAAELSGFLSGNGNNSKKKKKDKNIFDMRI